ncbi:hypothetical protein Taro_045426 [Colocasia esculenta]|uniref:Uncharacterized protein n=1 Tax=Colocasia esculenta TaxID=4460 RepID=A0A843X078_COLES|nr:hypothetical protein [Colocasia esculenta]
MRKIRGFRLGRRLARVWRWVRRRPCNRSYLRFRPTEDSSPSWSSQACDAKYRTAVAAKIAGWGRCLARRLRPSPRSGKEDNTRHLLGHGDDNHHLWEQPPQQREDEVEDMTPPKGHLPVYVGRNDVDPPRRVLVPVIYFNHPLFGELLRGAEEEFDFRHPGGITIPCPISDFESVRTLVAAASGIGCRHGGRSPRARRWPLTLS